MREYVKNNFVVRIVLNYTADEIIFIRQNGKITHKMTDFRLNKLWEDYGKVISKE